MHIHIYIRQAGNLLSRFDPFIAQALRDKDTIKYVRTSTGILLVFSARLQIVEKKK